MWSAPRAAAYIESTLRRSRPPERYGASPAQHLALHALTIENAAAVDADGWEQLGADLRTIGIEGNAAAPELVPAGRAVVTVDGSRPERTLVRVQARDQIGLVSTICHWFADHELSVESLHAETDRETAHDVLIVTGSCRAHELAQHLSCR